MITHASQLVDSRIARLTAVVCLVAMTAVACASSTTQIAADRIIEPSAAVAENAPEYGSSLEDWGHSLADPNPDANYSPTNDAQDAEPDQAASGVPSIAWDDLIPPGFSGQEIVARYEERLDAVEPGSAEASALFAEMQADFDPEAVNDQLDGQVIRLAGFVAPLSYDDDIVTEFLLVPTYGACIHVPPPPPNQTIMVTVDKADGLTTDEAWGAVWVEGTISVTSTTTDLASASYTITNATSGVYSDF